MVGEARLLALALPLCAAASCGTKAPPADAGGADRAPLDGAQGESTGPQDRAGEAAPDGAAADRPDGATADRPDVAADTGAARADASSEMSMGGGRCQLLDVAPGRPTDHA